LRGAAVIADPVTTHDGVVHVRSARVTPSSVTQHGSLDIVLTEPDAAGRRELRGTGTDDSIEPWFTDTLLRAVSTVLGAFGDPHRAVAQLPRAAPGDTALAVEFGTRSFAPLGPLRPLTTLTAPIAAAVGKHSHRTAVTSDGQMLTYGELWSMTRAMAIALREYGVGRGDRVALLTEKTVRAVPAILGILVAGAAYVPLDARSPQARLAEILADAQCAAVVVDAAVRSLLPDSPAERVVDLDTAVAHRGGETSSWPEPLPSDPAYLLYTAGSTGRPKGVQVSHGAVASYISWKIGYDGIGPDTQLLQLPSFAFDSSVGDLFPVLSRGGCLVLADAHRLRPHQIADLIAQHGITHMMSVPSLYSVLLDSLGQVGTTLRVVTVAGEATTPDIVQRHHTVLPNVRLVNEYGLTENSVGATAFDHTTDAGPGLPIGYPISNTIARVVDLAGADLPAGFVGELELSGHGLADGYHNQPEQTAAVFVSGVALPGGRSYRTGDLAWWRPDGMLEFVGRADEQVKIRGQRVEPTEVEAVLASLPGVRHAVVAVVGSPDSGRALAAWLVADESDVAQLRAAAARRLAPAMRPASLIVMNSLPRLLSGKVDRASLIDQFARSSALPSAVTLLPAAAAADTDPVVGSVAGIFEELLETSLLGPNADFFELGGHSLLAISMLDEVEARLGVSLDLESFFQHCTVAAVADMVRHAREADTAAVSVSPVTT